MTQKNSKAEIILASTSTYRKIQLERLGVRFTAVKPDFNEDAHKNKNLSASDYVLQLASGKAESLINTYPDSLIIGADQTVVFEGQYIGKSGSRDKAVEQLMKMQGKTHEIVTGLVLLGPQKKLQHVEIVKLKMRPLELFEIESYVDLDQPFDCAGSYKIEKAGIRLFSDIIAKDFSSIEGLPMLKLVDFLLQSGVHLT